MMDCLYAECTPVITDCVMAELEKLGQKYRVALKVAKVRPLDRSSSGKARGGLAGRGPAPLLPPSAAGGSSAA